MIAATRPLASVRWRHLSLAALILGAWAVLGLWGTTLHLHVAMEMSGGAMSMPLQLPVNACYANQRTSEKNGDKVLHVCNLHSSQLTPSHLAL